MTYYRISDLMQGTLLYVAHWNGSQRMYDAIQFLATTATHGNGIPLSLELDGWADDQAAPGDTFEGCGLRVECIDEQTFREETGQTDVPTKDLQTAQ